MSRATTIRTPRADSKVARAIKVFCEMSGFSRALVIDRYKSELDMTEKAASTYYQMCRKKAGLVTPRAERASAAK